MEKQDGYMIGKELGRYLVVEALGEGGMFLNYLEVSGLTPGVHTIQLECLGIAGDGGGIHVAMRYFGFSTRPISASVP
jgi:hypothetical protein